MKKRALCILLCLVLCLALLPVASFAATSEEGPVLTLTPQKSSVPAVPGTVVKFDGVLSNPTGTDYIINKYNVWINGVWGNPNTDFTYESHKSPFLGPDETLNSTISVTLTEDMCKNSELNVAYQESGRVYGDDYRNEAESNKATATVTLSSPIIDNVSFALNVPTAGAKVSECLDLNIMDPNLTFGTDWDSPSDAHVFWFEKGVVGENMDPTDYEPLPGDTVFEDGKTYTVYLYNIRLLNNLKWSTDGCTGHLYGQECTDYPDEAQNHVIFHFDYTVHAFYPITVTGGYGTFDGTDNVTTSDVNAFTAGTKTILTADEKKIPEGKVFDKWVVTKGNFEIKDADKADGASFVTVAEAMEIKATYKDKDAAPAAAPVDYTVTKGEGQTYTLKSGKTLSFTCNGELKKFTGAKIDGKDVAAENYSTVSGSTILTLKTEYLDKLSTGGHTIQFIYSDGQSNVAKFNVAKASAGTAISPKTGDYSQFVLLSAMLGLAGFALVTKKLKTKKEEQ